MSRILILLVLLACFSAQAQLRFTKEVQNIAQLRQLNVNDINRTANVKNYATPGDGGGGLFEYDATATGTPDDGIRIAPNVGSGMWIRKVDGREYMARWWGPNKTNATVQAAIDWVSANGYGGVTVDGGTWYVKTDDSTRILMKSGVTLKTAEDSMIVALPNPTNNWILIDFPIGASDCGVGPARLIGWNLLPPGGDTNKSGVIFSMQDTTNVVIGGIKADNWYTQYADVGSGNVNLKLLDENWQPTIRAMGVMGDGRDDTRNVQAAWHYHERYNKHVDWPWTTNGYTFTTAYITNGVGLVNEGHNTLIKIFYSNPTEGVLPHFSSIGISADNCVFRGFNFQTIGAYPVTETNAPNSGFFAAIHIHIATNTLIENCSFDVESGKAIGIGGSGTVVRNCLFNRCGFSAGLDNDDNWLWYESASPFKGQKYSPIGVKILNNTFMYGSPFKHTAFFSSADDFVFEGNKMLEMNTLYALLVYTGDEGTTDINGTNVYRFGGKIINNTISGTNFGDLHGAIGIFISTPTNYVAPTFDPYSMYSAIQIRGNHIIASGTNANSNIGIRLLSAKDTKISDNFIQTSGTPIWPVGNNSRLLVENNHLECTLSGIAGTITFSEGFLQPPRNEDQVWRFNKIYSPPLDEYAIHNIEPIILKNFTLQNNDFIFRGDVGTNRSRLIQFTKSEGFITVENNTFNLTNGMSGLRVAYIHGTNATTRFNFNTSVRSSNSVVVLRGASIETETVHVEGNEVGAMDFAYVRDLKVIGNDLSSNTNLFIPLEMTLIDKAIITHNAMTNYSTIAAMVASIGATNSIFEHNIVSGNSSSELVRNTLGKMYYGNNVVRNIGAGGIRPVAAGGSISHFIYENPAHIDIGDIAEAPFSIRRTVLGVDQGTYTPMLDNYFVASARDVQHHITNSGGFMSGQAFFVQMTNGVEQFMFGLHGFNPPTMYIGDPTNAMAFRIGAGTVANSSLLRTASDGTVSPVTIGANLTFDGTTLAAGSGSGASGLAGTLSATRVPVASGPTNLIDSSIWIVDTNIVLRRNNTSGIYLIASNTLSATRFGQSGVTGIIETEAAGSSIQFTSGGVQTMEFGTVSFGPFVDDTLDLGTAIKRVKSAYISDSIVLGVNNIAVTIAVGGGNPETVIIGRPGDFFIRTNGVSGALVYIKASGVNTTSGWKSVANGKKNYLKFNFPRRVDGAGCTIPNTNDFTLPTFMVPRFSGTAVSNANYCLFAVRVPSDLEATVAPRASLSVRLTGTDTGAQIYNLGFASVANSSIATATVADWIKLDIAADASGASDDVESVSDVALSGWLPTPGQWWVLQLNRAGSVDASTVASELLELQIEYESNQ